MIDGTIDGTLFLDPSHKPKSYEELLAIVRRQTEELARYEETVSMSSQRMRTVLNNLPMSLVIVGDRGTIEAVNDKTLQIFGYRTEELIDQSIGKLFANPSVLKVGADSVETTAYRRSGEEFPCDVRITEVEMNGSDRLFVYVQDITERHRLQQLRRDFLLMISHDLRNPLMSVIGFLELMNEGSYGEIPERAMAASARAFSTAEYITSLVTQLLDAEKLDLETISLDRQTKDMAAIVERSLDALRDQAHKTNVVLESKLESVMVDVDEERVLQALINVIANAIKFSPPESTVSIAVSVENDQCIVTVTDQGPGIPPDALETIFERYAQTGDAADKRRGFGLGLFIARRLVERHGGRICAESELGNGSKFTLTFPTFQA